MTRHEQKIHHFDYCRGFLITFGIFAPDHRLIRPAQATGTEVYAVYTENIGLSPRPFMVGIVNSGSSAASVQVHGIGTSGTQYLANATTVAAGQDAVFLVDSLTITRPGHTTQGVFRITSDKPAMAYQMSTSGSAQSNDATWLLPMSHLGTSYHAVTYNQGAMPPKA